MMSHFELLTENFNRNSSLELLEGLTLFFYFGVTNSKLKIKKIYFKSGDLRSI